MTDIAKVSPAIDQATLAKWESGESGLRVEDLAFLARIYGTQPDRLFYPPGDESTPQLLTQAHSIITTCDPVAVRAWLTTGTFLPKAQGKSD